MRSRKSFVVIFKETKKKEKRKERTNHLIWGLPHRKRKEKKANKLSGKQANVTTERFLQFLSLSSWLCIFWIYIDSNKEDREKERKLESLHLLTIQTFGFSDNFKFTSRKLCVFYYNNIQHTFHLLIYSFKILKPF